TSTRGIRSASVMTVARLTVRWVEKRVRCLDNCSSRRSVKDIGGGVGSSLASGRPQGDAGSSRVHSSCRRLSGLSVSGSFRLAADDNQPGTVGAAHHGTDYEHPLASRERRGANAVDGAVLTVLATDSGAALRPLLNADDRGPADQVPRQRGAVGRLDDDRTRRGGLDDAAFERDRPAPLLGPQRDLAVLAADEQQSPQQQQAAGVKLALAGAPLSLGRRMMAALR